MGDHPTHLDEKGRARMVDVGHKPVVRRRAVAEAVVRTTPEAARALYDGRLPKGDAAAVARVAGIAGAKRTSDLIALCHPLPLDRVAVDVGVAPSEGEVRIRCEALASARTGVEMEALTGAAVGGLNVYDMLKAIDAAVTIEVRLIEKTKDAPEA